MNARTEFQAILGSDGKPQYFVVPAAAFERIRPLLEEQARKDGIPQEVVEAHVLHGVPLIKAWREYLGLTQQQVCERAGLLQPALARMENAATVLRKATREKLAAAMNIREEFLRI